MVNLIQEKISNQPVTGRNIAGNKNIPKVEEKTAPPVTNVKHAEGNNTVKNILPLSLIAGGGLLLYYGLKKPNKLNFFKNLAKERFFEIEKNIKEFTTYSSKLIETSFGDSLEHIEAYKKNRFLDVSVHIQNIVRAANAKETISAQNNAFKTLSRDFNEYRRAGASDFDTFKVKLGNSVREVSNQIEGKRWKTNIACGDLTLMPKFKNGENELLVDETEKRLVALAQSASSEMLNFKNKKLHNVVLSQSKSMADAITKARELASNAKGLIIDSTFEKFRRLLNLSEDFVPGWNKTPTLENFTKLSPEELKPQKLPAALDEIFEANSYWTAVKSKDFSGLKEDDLRKIFYSASYSESIKDIGIMIDRLRLLNEYEKSCGKNNEKLYKNSIAKLECLSVKLEDFGEKELLKRCSANFDNITPEQRVAKVYYVNEVSRRLGFNTLSDMDEYFTKNNQTYNQSSLKKYINIIKDNPDIYFM